MTCDEAEILLHALLDGELDAGHARDVEAHVAGCSRCAAQMRDYRQMHETMAASDLHFPAPLQLRRRVEAAIPAAGSPNRRSILQGFAMGSVLSGAAAAGIAVFALRADDQQQLLTDVVSAHLRSLQPGHLTDVLSSDQHTVKPWFNGRLDVAPPVIDLTAQGFTLIGGRLDYVDAKPIAAIVYRRRIHVINLFVAQAADTERHAAMMETVQGFNIRRWSEQGLNYWAVSDLNADELSEFGDKLETALRAG